MKRTIVDPKKLLQNMVCIFYILLAIVMVIVFFGAPYLHLSIETIRGMAFFFAIATGIALFLSIIIQVVFRK